LSEITTLFTDQPLPEELMRKCRDWGTGVQVAG
jgi:DeoR family transcriptional regulator, glycerol-3-phosphate regulon repressor